MGAVNVEPSNCEDRGMSIVSKEDAYKVEKLINDMFDAISPVAGEPSCLTLSNS